jgi:hypothetical protein
VRIFRNKPFTRFARKARITDAELCAAVANIKRGLIDADLGGGVIKQRIARQGGGKSGGFRALILLRVAERAFLRPRLREERSRQHPGRRTRGPQKARRRDVEL